MKHCACKINGNLPKMNFKMSYFNNLRAKFQAAADCLKTDEKYILISFCGNW